MAVFVVVIFAPTSTKFSKSFFKEFTNQDGVVIKDGSKVRITALTVWLSSNSRRNNAKITRFYWSRKSRNSCPISSGATRNVTFFFSFSILRSSPTEGLKKLHVKCLLP